MRAGIETGPFRGPGPASPPASGVGTEFCGAKIFLTNRKLLVPPARSLVSYITSNQFSELDHTTVVTGVTREA